LLLRGLRRLDNFMWGQAHRFDVVLGWHSSHPVECRSNKWQEGDGVRLVDWVRYVPMTVEGSVDLPVIVTILFEDVPQ
jgi:hypothetical protein